MLVGQSAWILVRYVCQSADVDRLAGILVGQGQSTWIDKLVSRSADHDG